MRKKSENFRGNKLLRMKNFENFAEKAKKHEAAKEK